MTDAKPEKIVIFATRGPDDPERVTFPFVMGAGGRAVSESLEATAVLNY